MAAGNVYCHFRNKEEIILHAYERALLVYDEVWDRAGARADPPVLRRASDA